MENANLIQNYRELDRDCALLHYKLNAQKQFEAQPIAPTPENHAQAESDADALIARINALPAPSPAFEIVSNHMRDFMHAEKLAINNYFTKLGGSMGSISWKAEMLTMLDSRPLDERANAMLREIEATKALWQGVKPGLSGQSEAEVSAFCANCEDSMDTLVHYADNVEAYFKGVSAAGAEELRRSMKDLCTRLGDYAIYARALLPKTGANTKADDGKIIRLDEHYYRAVLRDNLGVELDELLKWHESEIQKTRAEVFEIASRLPIAQGNITSMGAVNDVLLKYAGPCASAAEMFERTAGYLKRTREVARQYVSYPEEECMLENVPYSLRRTFPWGGYADGDGVGQPWRGMLFMNGYNYTALTDGWMKMNTIHEAYPGHHIQYVRAASDPRPETMKIGAKYIPMIEGMAHRNERAFQFVFDEDPFFPLFVAYRRHHTAVRIKCDLMLRYFGRPISEAVKLYMDELGFDYETARGQVRAQEHMEGYFTCYYYGMKKTTDWEKQLGYNMKEYSEILLFAGNISMENFEKYLKMGASEREVYAHEFKSLLMR